MSNIQKVVYTSSTFQLNENITSVDCNYASWNNNKMYYIFNFCSNLHSVSNISDTVINMTYTFNNCRALVNAPSIPNSVTSMYGIFAGCQSLSNIPTIPNSVTNIGTAFYACRNLVNAPIIPNSVVAMGRTFYGCTNLTGDVVIYSSNITNATNAFYGSKKKDVYIPFNSTTYNTFINAGYDENGTLYNVYLKDINTYVNPDAPVEPDVPTGPTYVQTTLSDYVYTTSGSTTYLNTYNGTYEYINLPTN